MAKQKQFDAIKLIDTIKSYQRFRQAFEEQYNLVSMEYENTSATESYQQAVKSEICEFIMNEMWDIKEALDEQESRLDDLLTFLQDRFME